ncbi:MAG: DUF2285 domain-containing protein [Sphingobium sp.]
MPLVATVLRSDGQYEEAIFECAGETVHLVLRQGTLLEGPVRLVYEVDSMGLSHRLIGLQRWQTLLSGTPMPTRLQLRKPGQDRWLQLIATLDAISAGLSLRQTAIAVFGLETVEQDWKHESDFLKMRTRRLVARARHLAAGGYRDLL